MATLGPGPAPSSKHSFHTGERQTFFFEDPYLTQLLGYNTCCPSFVEACFWVFHDVLGYSYDLGLSSVDGVAGTTFQLFFAGHPVHPFSSWALDQMRNVGGPIGPYVSAFRLLVG